MFSFVSLQGKIIMLNTIIILAAFMIIILDLTRIINLSHKAFLSIFIIFMPHFLIMRYYLLGGYIWSYYRYSIMYSIMIISAYIYMKITLFPNVALDIKGRRIKVLFSGIKLIFYGIYTCVMEIIFYIFIYIISKKINITKKIIISDMLLTVIFLSVIIADGTIRILCASRKLKCKNRIIISGTIWMPLVNLFTIIYVKKIEGYCKICEDYRCDMDKIKIESCICSTKYPIILVHGVGFRDFTYLNYWGRIPHTLIKNGARVYYGGQVAFGKVEDNAESIKRKIFEILNETKAEKVNIIAHSKGGLDARYAISNLDMGKYVASLTMISSPNKGVKFVDYACRLPDKFYRYVSRLFDRYFLSIGDSKSDFYNSTRMFSTELIRKFNEETKDAEGVYYQSYASVMKNMFSDYILTIPYLLIKFTESSNNDGLVSVDSAKWGVFKGVFKNNLSRRGISHGDMVDMKREDFKGFNVLDKYVEIVSELKNKGY